MPQATIFHYCPQCNQKFHPNRLGQLFCSQEHGWQYRNLMRMTAEPETLARLKGQLLNLKIVLKLALTRDCTQTVREFKTAGFDEYYAKRESDFDTDTIRFFNCFGFGVAYERNEVTVYPAWEEFNPLNAENL